MESLQMIAANILYEDAKNGKLASCHEAINAVFNFPETWDARPVWFRFIDIPTSTRPYQYLVAWIDATPPRQVKLFDFLSDVLEPDLLEQMQAGRVVEYKPRWCGSGWVLEADSP